MFIFISVIKAESDLPANVSASVTTKSYNRTRTTALVEEPHFGRFDVRVGKIVHIEKHPDADSLYIEKVDVGEEHPRTIISALVKHVAIEEMQNRSALFLVNLKPIKMRGVLSEGMIMCALNENGTIEILIPPPGAESGEFVQVDGYERDPDDKIDVKKRVFEVVQRYLKTNDQRVATYKGKPWYVADKGIVMSPTLSNATIR